MLETAGEAGTNSKITIFNLLLHMGQPLPTDQPRLIDQLRTNTDRSLEHLPSEIDNTDGE